ncbi:MAG TPA: NAD(P)-dependent oxidoreductase, partial [Ktedonobacteraceae bacterium]|nr:NAD(P)-dependent oxidoreductase [Ktedonobacteraceae bacterium]
MVKTVPQPSHRSTKSLCGIETETNYYPIMLDVRGQPAIVVGGDCVAAEKAANLSTAGARVTVISPSFCDELLDLERNHAVTLHHKAYEHG